MKKVVLLFVFFVLANHISHAGAFKDSKGKSFELQADTRIAVTSWLETELLLSLDANLVAMADKQGFKDYVDTFTIPKNIIDLGDRHKPSLELLKSHNIDTIILKSNDLNKDIISKMIKQSIILEANTILDYDESINIYKNIAKAMGKEEIANKNLKRLKDSIQTLEETLTKKGIKNITMLGHFNKNTVRAYNKDLTLSRVLKEAGANVFEIAEKKHVWNCLDNVTTVDFIAKAKDQPLDIIVYLGMKNKYKEFSKSPIFQSFIKKNNIKVVAVNAWTWGNVMSYIKFAEDLNNQLK